MLAEIGIKEAREVRKARKERVPRSLRSSSLVRRLTTTVTLTSAADVIVGSNAVSSAQEWTPLAQVYTEYRVLSLHITPLVNTANADVIFGTDPSGQITAFVTGAGVFSLKNVKIYNAENTSPWFPSYDARATESQHRLFQTTSATIAAANRFAVHCWNLGTSGTAYVSLIAEFRGLSA